MLAAPAHAQTPPASPPQGTAAPTSQVPPDTDYAPPAPTVPARIASDDFVVPDLPDGWSRYTSYDGKAVSVRFSNATIIDYNSFVQDDNSRTQVGRQQNEWDVRTQRLMFRGSLKFKHPIGYFISAEIKGKDHVQSGNSSFGFTDFEFNTSLGRLGTLRVGKIKEPFAYEMVGDAANLQQQERALSPFFASRGIGAKIVAPFARDTMTWSAGWFNDWWVEDQSFRVSGNDIAGRFTAVPYWKDGGATYVHLGAGVRYLGRDEGTLRFRGRPESNVTDYYVDTDSLPSDHSTNLGLEALAGRGPFLVSGEYAHASMNAIESGHPDFWGAYVAVSYVLTGEHRPYDKKVAYARRVMPERRIGAWEVVGRYSHVDLTDQTVDGGVFDRWTAGVNWWATRRWKFGFDYGYIDLDRGGLSGVTHAFHSRLQWVY